MTFPFFRSLRERWRLRGVPRDLSPHLMRDIGLEPWPERPLLPLHLLW
ncbi:hypothetical protein [Maritimibacter sp. 55A14]|nr:hypothetical protein [Maritimibacter sp. 55A14]